MEELLKDKGVVRERPAVQQDMWVHFSTSSAGSKLLQVEKTNDCVYFQHGQVVEVHRPVVRICTSWWGLRKQTELRFEIEEGVYCISQEFGESFYFMYYEEYVSLYTLPHETRFIPTDRFVKMYTHRKKKKVNPLSQFFSSLVPKPALVVAARIGELFCR